MNSLNFLYVGVGGGLGAMARYGVSLLANSSVQTSEIAFPWATLTVNLIGCFTIGLLWQMIGKNNGLSMFWIIGFLGGFTTFSSFGLDGYKLLTQEAFTHFGAYVLMSNIAGLLLVFIGIKLGQLIQLG